MDKFYVGHIMLGIQIISVLCLISFLFTVIFYVPQKHNSRTIILKAVLFFIVYTQFIFLIYSSKYYLDIKFLTYTEAVIFYLTMPFMYMYYKNILYNKPLLRGNNGKHLLASIPGLIYFIFYNMQDKMLQEKMLLIKNADLLNDDLLMGIGISIQIIYLIMSIRLLLNFEKKNDKKITKETRTLIHIHLLLLYILIILGITSGILVYTLPEVFQIHHMLLIMLVLIYICFYYIYIKLNKVELTYNKIQEKFPDILNTTKDFIETNLMYLKQKCDLPEISKTLKIPSYKISKSINSEYGISFPEYINRLRITHATKLLLEQKEAFTKMDFLAFECGFNSRSTFYKEFKKTMGITPSEFKKLNS